MDKEGCGIISHTLLYFKGLRTPPVDDLCTISCRCSKLERDVKQKRALIEEYRRKQVVLKELLSAKDADIVSR